MNYESEEIMKKLFLIMSFLMLISVLGACVSEESLEAVDPNSVEKVIFEIPEGSSAKDVSNLLKEAGLIKSSGSFIYYLKQEKISDQIKAGKYELGKSMDVETIAKKITSGEVFIDTVSILIPEGYEFRMIVDKLVDEMGLSKEKLIDLAENHEFNYKFLENKGSEKYRLEGFLFPATYSFEKKADELEVLTAMLDKFDSEFKEEYYTRTKELGLTVKELITMASIVEREGASLEEFPKIAGVFYNRVRDNIKFQSCATVQYILEERKENLLDSDTEIDNPYNTYKNFGLPPGPISSPGLNAIKAALYPEEHDYYYFVVSGDNDGKHIFSKTLEEHEAAATEAFKKLGN